ncbi:hypothetical protein [uncultured Chitinophaga sp.]|uniref:hypothetical protein n=1 Tax=uncultured Chitinophaga sp. TaxID=339340 RepID=UPI0025E4C0D6|nr:hypothetical protein [uncultured Chitinophaga sp.]
MNNRTVKSFNEPGNVAVFTTRYVIRQGHPILNIFHHEDDGAWVFVGDDVCHDDSDYLLLALEEIIEHDPSVLDVADLPLGWCAIRDKPGRPWLIQKM